MSECLVLYYDKECPFCDAYANYLVLKQNYSLKLKNARDNKEEIALFCPKMDINNGFIIVYNSRCYQGVDALVVLNGLIENRGIVAFLHKIFYSNTLLSKALYTIAFLLRKIALTLMQKQTKI